MGIEHLHDCEVCGRRTTFMRPSTCLECHDITIELVRSGRWEDSLGWTRYQWSVCMPHWWQERAGSETRTLVSLLADTGLRLKPYAWADDVTRTLGLASLDRLAAFLIRLRSYGVIDLTLTYPRALDDDVSGDHGPLCGCQRWTIELRPRPPKPPRIR